MPGPARRAGVIMALRSVKHRRDRVRHTCTLEYRPAARNTHTPTQRRHYRSQIRRTAYISYR